MNRNLENINKVKCLELLKKMELGIISMLENYAYLYTDNELRILRESEQSLKVAIKQVTSDSAIDVVNLKKILELERDLKPYCYRCWYQDAIAGFDYISWFKADKLGDIPPVVSATFSNDIALTFCNSRYGIKYDISIEAFLGACEKDAATVVEPDNRHTFYTIGKTKDGRIINSYNLATTLITPMQALDNTNNTYLSKHNEIILDSNYITPRSVVYFNESDLEMVALISQRYSIPIEKIDIYDEVNERENMMSTI